MIINGSSRRNIAWWSRHLSDRKRNDRAEIKEIRGLGADDLKSAMLEMQFDARDTQCQNFMWICDVSPAVGERLTEAQWDVVYAQIEKHRGIPEGQPRIVIEHEKEGRGHRHLVYSRIDSETMKAWSDSYDARVCHAASRDISKELGLQHTKSPFDKDYDGDRSKRNPKHWEMFRGMKTDLDPRDVTAEVTSVYRNSIGAHDFIEELEANGYRLVRGDRRNFCILDRTGHEHSLARRLDGVNTKELRAFMAGVDFHELPSVAEAKQGHRAKVHLEQVDELNDIEKEIAWEEKLARAAIEKEKIERRFVEKFSEKTSEASLPKKEKKLQGMSEKLAQLYKHCDGPDAFRVALNQKHIGLARVSKDEAEQSHRQATFAAAVGNFSPRFREGDIVAVSTPRVEYRRDGEIFGIPNRVHRLDQDFARDLIKITGLEKRITSIEELTPVLDKMADRDEARWEKIRQANATVKQKGRVRNAIHSAADAAAMPLPSLGRSAKVGGKLLGHVADAIDSLFAAPATPQQKAIADHARLERSLQASETELRTSQEACDMLRKRSEENAINNIKREVDRGRDR